MKDHDPNRHIVLVGFALAMALLSACSSAPPANPADPWEKTNRSIYKFNDKLDRYVLKPASDAYVKVTTQTIRDCVHHASTNLGEIDSVGNDILQAKFRQTGNDFLRMLVNSTLGVGGLFDMATPMHLKHHDEDFGLTLGTWGIPQGRYMVLPFFGPTTTRDAPGIAVGILDDPLTWIYAPEIIYPIDALQVIDFRASAENLFRFRNAAALDPYVFTRDAYLKHRQFQLQGEAAQTQPAETINYFEDEGQTMASTQPAATTGPLTQPAATQSVSQPATEPAPSRP